MPRRPVSASIAPTLVIKKQSRLLHTKATGALHYSKLVEYAERASTTLDKLELLFMTLKGDGNVPSTLMSAIRRLHSFIESSEENMEILRKTFGEEHLNERAVKWIKDKADLKQDSASKTVHTYGDHSEIEYPDTREADGKIEVIKSKVSLPKTGDDLVGMIFAIWQTPLMPADGNVVQTRNVIINGRTIKQKVRTGGALKHLLLENVPACEFKTSKESRIIDKTTRTHYPVTFNTSSFWGSVMFESDEEQSTYTKKASDMNTSADIISIDRILKEKNISWKLTLTSTDEIRLIAYVFEEFEHTTRSVESYNTSADFLKSCLSLLF